MQRGAKGIIAPLLATGRIMVNPIMVDRITADLIMEEVIRAPSPSTLAIGLTTFAALVITWAGPITSGGQDIGHRDTVRECGSTAITLCEDIDRATLRADRYLNNRLSQAPARQTETRGSGHAT